MDRKSTRQVFVGDVPIGGGAPISVQSMTCTKTEDDRATVEQIKRLEEVGCEIVRVAVPNEDAAEAIGRIKKEIRIPLVADVHFNYRLALMALEQGADKIRINPGNIGSKERVKRVLLAAKERRIPVRIGVNAGSLEKEFIKKYDGITAEGLVESALKHVRICESFGFEDVVVSIKAADVPLMIEANRRLSVCVDYPIHLGVTEAGTPRRGVLRSAVGIGTLLAEGIGDTIRVSLTGDPVDEVRAGYDILKSLRLRERGLTIISCPTCGRLETNLIPIVEEVERILEGIDTPLTLAIMGCAVNGPGEAREADIGVACGKGSALLFRKGEVIRKIKEKDIVKTLVEEVHGWET
ncbi:MAG: flavodoxin-dependent (E)-4-hydroxy-3-methylbut-2-enyl-diphosphate synthase [bacterium]